MIVIVLAARTVILPSLCKFCIHMIIVVIDVVIEEHSWAAITELQLLKNTDSLAVFTCLLYTSTIYDRVQFPKDNG